MKKFPKKMSNKIKIQKMNIKMINLKKKVLIKLPNTKTMILKSFLLKINKLSSCQIYSSISLITIIIRISNK